MCRFRGALRKMLYLLIGFRNRALVMPQWIWAYITRSGASPLITDYRSSKFDETRSGKP